MHPINPTNQVRIEALQRFGYTEREAAFLCLAGLHSGYFLRRQYVQFLGKSAGGTAAALIDRALALEHVKACTYAAHTHIYHLCSRPFYAALGQRENRNRRDRRPLTMKIKLMTLDFVLNHREYTYLVTEQEKFEYFTAGRNVDAESLPATTFHAGGGTPSTVRYFVDKFPIYTGPVQPTGVSEPAFCYVDAGATSVSGFETYLFRYRSLFESLPQFNVVYVAARPLLFGAAERLFRRFAGQSWSRNGAEAPAVNNDLRAYFEARCLYERGELASFDRAKLLRFRDQRDRFSGSETETQYAQWRSCHERKATGGFTSSPEATAALGGSFSVCLLTHSYDLFGSLTLF